MLKFKEIQILTTYYNKSKDFLIYQLYSLKIFTILYNILLLFNNYISKNSKLLTVKYSIILSINSPIMIILKHLIVTNLNVIF